MYEGEKNIIVKQIDSLTIYNIYFTLFASIQSFSNETVRKLISLREIKSYKNINIKKSLIKFKRIKI